MVCRLVLNVELKFLDASKSSNSGKSLKLVLAIKEVHELRGLIFRLFPTPHMPPSLHPSYAPPDAYNPGKLPTLNIEAHTKLFFFQMITLNFYVKHIKLKINLTKLRIQTKKRSNESTATHFIANQCFTNF